MSPLSSFLLSAVQATAVQTIGVFGLLFFLGFLLAKVQHATHARYVRLFGWYGLYITAWIGTPVHELSHVLVAKLFRHRVTHISLFAPNKETGGLGHIDHSYNPHNVIHQMGNAFIGAAPMLIGPLILLGLLHVLIPEVATAWTALFSSPGALPTTQSLSPFLAALRQLSLSGWQPIVFLYLSICIVSHMAPSRADRASMWRGLGWLIAVAFVVNLIFVVIGSDPTKFINRVSDIVWMYAGVFLYALGISLLHFFTTTVLFTPIARVLGK